jgi:putative restriction endonuclease
MADPSLNRTQVLQQFDGLNVWTRGEERAPHKPLLVLLALGNLNQGITTLIAFSEVDVKLTALLKEFGPSRKSYHPEYPFWRLQNDGVWTIENADELETREGSTDAKKSELLKHNTHGGFSADILQALHADPQLIADIAHRLLDAHFPESLHADILDAVGLELDVFEHTQRRKRDPAFRTRILTAYEHRCSVCGFDVRIGTNPLGIEAAHIKWHQADGPDEERNGLCLCSLHHKMLDMGAFTVSSEFLLLVSKQAHGRRGFDEWLMRFHAQRLRSPVRSEYEPAGEFLEWHTKQVFKQPPREIPVVK